MMESTNPEELLETHSDPFKSRCALLVSVLAMVLALASLGGSNASKEATMHNILAANAYAFYQAKNIRQTSYKLAADDFQIMLANEKISPAVRELLDSKLQAYKKNIDRYESEPDTKEGKKELMQQAKEHEHERDLALKRDPWFDYAEALLQIAIVLTSVALITSVRMLLGVSMTLGALGVFCTLNGYLLFV
jgi:Domain of unknown function (DUF4337)